MAGLIGLLPLTESDGNVGDDDQAIGLVLGTVCGYDDNNDDDDKVDDYGDGDTVNVTNNGAVLIGACFSLYSERVQASHLSSYTLIVYTQRDFSLTLLH